MTDLLITDADPARSGTCFSSRVVGQLGPAEQLVLWALRQRLTDGDNASPQLVYGFRLAFGLGRLEAGLAAFEGVFTTLVRHARPDIGLCPLRCGCVSRDEEMILQLASLALAGSGSRFEALTDGLVEPLARMDLRRHTRALGMLLHQAGLQLPAPTGLIAITRH